MHRGIKIGDLKCNLFAFSSIPAEYLQKFEFLISRGSVATCLRWGGSCCIDFVTNFIRFPALYKFWKSVKIWQSYRELKGGNFFWDSVVVNHSTINIQWTTYTSSSLRVGLKLRRKSYENTEHQYTRRTIRPKIDPLAYVRPIQKSLTEAVHCCRRTSVSPRVLSFFFLLSSFSPSNLRTCWMELNHIRPHGRHSEVNAIWKCMSVMWGYLFRLQIGSPKTTFFDDFAT